MEKIATICVIVVERFKDRKISGNLMIKWNKWKKSVHQAIKASVSHPSEEVVVLLHKFIRTARSLILTNLPKSTISNQTLLRSHALGSPHTRCSSLETSHTPLRSSPHRQNSNRRTINTLAQASRSSYQGVNVVLSLVKASCKYLLVMAFSGAVDGSCQLLISSNRSIPQVLE